MAPEQMPGQQIFAIDRIAARVTPYKWSFATENAEAIAAHWAGLVQQMPAMFNGTVLLQHRGEARDAVFEADYFPIDYASFIYWHRSGFPPAAVGGATIRNGFAMSALRTRDDAYLMGVMGAHTANAGKIYFAAGTPDLKDVLAGGEVDLAGSALRELEEETGLAANEVSVGDGWRIVLGRERVAFMRDVLIDLPALEAQALIRDRLARQAEPELADIVIARSVADIDADRMPPFMQAFLRHAFEDPRP
jgi:8-oxo-dGTP pyrophosphatase MutT (NUDIX family)